MTKLRVSDMYTRTYRLKMIDSSNVFAQFIHPVTRVWQDNYPQEVILSQSLSRGSIASAVRWNPMKVWWPNTNHFLLAQWIIMRTIARTSILTCFKTSWIFSPVCDSVDDSSPSIRKTWWSSVMTWAVYTDWGSYVVLPSKVSVRFSQVCRCSSCRVSIRAASFGICDSVKTAADAGS